jgi:hypothetical protein
MPRPLGGDRSHGATFITTGGDLLSRTVRRKAFCLTVSSLTLSHLTTILSAVIRPSPTVNGAVTTVLPLPDAYSMS